MGDPRENAIEVVRTLRDAGWEAYFAGGCVRDELLGYEAKDYDVATDARPDAVQGLFRRTRAVGKAFGVVLVTQARGVVVEVATFRVEGPYSDRRRPDSVTFSDAPSDAQRRDFTINALFLDPLAPESDWSSGARGRVIDHVRGIDDLRAGVIRAVGDPSARLAEDHLRALRAVRFAARYDFEIEPRTMEAIRADAAALSGVSRERIGDEVRRMLLHPTRAAAVNLLERLGLDKAILGDACGEPGDGAGLLPRVDMEAVRAASGDAGGVALGLAAWAIGRAGADARVDADFARSVVKRHRRALCLSNEESDALRDGLACLHAIETTWEDAGVAARKRLASSSGFASAIELTRARDAAAADGVEAAVAELARTPSGLQPPPLVTGDDLVAAGFAPGPAFKRLLDAAYDAQLEDRVSTKNEALDAARRARDQKR